MAGEMQGAADQASAIGETMVAGALANASHAAELAAQLQPLRAQLAAKPDDVQLKAQIFDIERQLRAILGIAAKAA